MNYSAPVQRPFGDEAGDASIVMTSRQVLHWRCLQTAEKSKADVATASGAPNNRRESPVDDVVTSIEPFSRMGVVSQGLVFRCCQAPAYCLPAGNDGSTLTTHRAQLARCPARAPPPVDYLLISTTPGNDIHFTVSLLPAPVQQIHVAVCSAVGSTLRHGGAGSRCDQPPEFVRHEHFPSLHDHQL